MKRIIFSILLLSCFCYGEDVMKFFDFGYVITDSVIWRTVEVDSNNLGVDTCKHKWVYSETWRAGGDRGCLVLHYGFHCSWDDRMRNKICKKCHRKETQREFWYQHRAEHVETEYEKLDKKSKEK